jgi:hypothetical protein
MPAKSRAPARANKKRDPFADATAGRDRQPYRLGDDPYAFDPKPDPKPEPKGSLLDSKTGADRKRFPITTGFLDYFPDAIAAAAEVSFLGNQKHNPGQPLHHSRGKSNDHADCIGRHLVQRGGFEDITIDGVVYKVRHSAAMFWRAGALLQEELENELGYALPRGATAE